MYCRHECHKKEYSLWVPQARAILQSLAFQEDQAGQCDPVHRPHTPIYEHTLVLTLLGLRHSNNIYFLYKCSNIIHMLQKNFFSFRKFTKKQLYTTTSNCCTFNNEETALYSQTSSMSSSISLSLSFSVQCN